MEQNILLALATGVFTFIAVALFARGILAGQARPYLLAWIIRASMCAVAFMSQLLQGATYSLALAGAQVIGVAFIIACILTMRAAGGGKLDRSDWLAIGIAGTGVLLWVISGNPVFGILGAILADTSATGLGIRSALQKNTEESIPFWGCSLLAATLALLAANGDGWAVMIAPFFSCLNALANIFTVLYVRWRNALPVPAEQWEVAE
jgi:hypothetical protein